MQNEAAASPKWSYQSRPRGPLQSFWAVCGLQRAPGSQVLDPAAYPAQTNGNYFSAAFSENQQPVRYYHCHTQKCFLKLHMAFILESTTGCTDTLQACPSQLPVWEGATVGMVLPTHHCSSWGFEWKVSHQGTWLVILLSARLLHCQIHQCPICALQFLTRTTCCSSMPLLTLSKSWRKQGLSLGLPVVPTNRTLPPSCLLTRWRKRNKKHGGAWKTPTGTRPN